MNKCHVGGIILCGGRSNRMGTDKPWLPCGGETLLQRITRITASVVAPVVVAARRDQVLPPLPQGVEVVYDAVENAGPLAGMAAGFAALRTRCAAAFVTACDHPLLKPQWIARLVELLDQYPAVVPQADNQPQPLSAVYRLDTLPMLSDLIASGQRKAQAFARLCGARIIPAKQFADVDPNLDSLRDCDDAAAYEAALRDLDSGSPPE